MAHPLDTEKATGSIVAGAVGDAMGWPFEEAAKRLGRLQPLTGPRFVAWSRRRGWMSRWFEEPVKPGEYSDDTQLTLATARSVLSGDEWWARFTQVELPTWLMYERGGGGATKRAANSWALQRCPWQHESSSDYWQAGGNGVCMRILPHAIQCVHGPFEQLAEEIILNGITTHGHPRALVPALLFGFALWLLLKQQTTLEYGELVHQTLREVRRWSHFPRLRHLEEEWRRAAGEAYWKIWENTVDEVTSLLRRAQSAMQEGALVVGPEALESFGAFDKRISGAGTVAAASALFLASRYAVSPMQAVVLAASSRGLDTDTIASMTGMLLGALHGPGWLYDAAGGVQDSAYLRMISRALAEGSNGRSKLYGVPRSVTRRDKTILIQTLRNSTDGADLRLPDGREATIQKFEVLRSGHPALRAERWFLRIEDGQTVYVSASVSARPERERVDYEWELREAPPLQIERIGLRLFVSDLRLAKDFYTQKLGFNVTEELDRSFTVADSIIFVQSTSASSKKRRPSQSSPIIRIRVPNIASIDARVKAQSIPVVSDPDDDGGNTRRISDPFGNVIEFAGL
jgi:ADP-ribosylglycohydrolase